MESPWMLDYDPATCAIGGAVAILGDRPTFLVLREAFMGVRRFGDMLRRTAMPRQVLTDRLAHLVAEGLLRKAAYRDAGQRTRHEYRLTAKGLDLYPGPRRAHAVGRQVRSRIGRGAHPAHAPRLR